MTKRRLDTISAVFWFVFASAVCYGAFLLGLGSPDAPGSGFILFWSGLFLAMLSVVILANSARPTSEMPHALGSISWLKVLVILAALVLYALLLERIGFILTSFLLLILLLGISDEPNWPAILAVAGGATLGSYALFDLWLNIRLPGGILGFG